VTIDERIEKLWHVTAAHIEQARKDYEENRRLWREQQTEIAAAWQRIERGFEESRREAAEMRQQAADMRREAHVQMTEMRHQMAERDRITDERIGNLVSAIGLLVRRLDKGSDTGTK
jgi:hypothetical protein